MQPNNRSCSNYEPSNSCDTSIVDPVSSVSTSLFTLQQTLEENASPSVYYRVFDCEDFLQNVQQWTTDLDKASNLLLDILLLYVKTCLNTNSSTSTISRGKGLKIPASAVGWLSTQHTNQPLCCRLSIETQNRFVILPQLKVWLSKYVTHLQVNGRDLWPPTHHETKERLHENEENSLNSRPTSDLKIRTDNNTTNPEEISKFMYHYHHLRYCPSLDLSLFPNLSVLILDGVPLQWILNLERIREHLSLLKVINTCIYDIYHMLTNPTNSKEDDSETTSQLFHPFLALEHMTISNCALREVSRMRRHDRYKPFMSYFPHLVSLDLSHNELCSMNTTLAGLSDLLNLSSINLSYNFLTSMRKCHLLLGNITTINLSHNRLRHVEGLDKLYSLENLMIDNNDIRSWADIVSITHLPQLMRLDIAGNPVVLEDPPLVRLHIFRCFLEARFDSNDSRPSYDEVQDALPKIDGSIISNDEFVSIEALSRAGFSAEGAPQTLERNKNHYFHSQFKATSIPIYVYGEGRIQRNVPRRAIEVHDINLVCDIDPIVHHAGGTSTDKSREFINLEQVVALRCNLLPIKSENSVAETSAGSSGVSEEDIASVNVQATVVEIKSAHESRSMDRQNLHEPPVADAFISYSSFQSVVDEESLLASRKCYLKIESDLTCTPLSPQSVFTDNLPVPVNHNERVNSNQNDEDSQCSLTLPSKHNFSIDEIESVYDGPECYKHYLVSKYMDCYFKNFIFPSPIKDDFHLNDTLINLVSSVKLPRIQLYQPDRELMLWTYADTIKKMDSADFVWEKVIHFSVEDVISCGISATSRIPPNDKVNRGFHGDILTDSGMMTYADSRRLIICVSNMAFYLMPTDIDTTSGTRSFPSSIPSNSVFNDGLWLHSYVYHPLKFLKRVTIGFRFQRITLHFSLPLLRDALYINSSHSNESTSDYTYIFITRNKKRAVNFIQMLLNANKRTGVTVDSPMEYAAEVQVNNDDAIALDNLSKLYPSSTWDEGIRHYQIVQQRWVHGERSPVRRVIVLTNHRIFLLHEFFIGDGCYRQAEVSYKSIGDSVLGLVDSADVADIIDVSVALEESRLITVTIKSPIRLIRSHRWRIICDEREDAEKLVEDIRKAMMGLTNGH